MSEIVRAPRPVCRGTARSGSTTMPIAAASAAKSQKYRMYAKCRNRPVVR